MTAELGNTNDPKALIPGDVGHVHDTAWSLRAHGDVLHEAGAGLKRIDTTDGWSGEAADRFRAVFHSQPGKWLQAGDCFHDASTALETYAYTLSWAQTQAGEAIQLWQEAQAATQAAQAQHAQAIEHAQQPTAPSTTAAPEIPFVDPGAGKRAAALSMLDRARSQLNNAGQTAADVVGRARDQAPPKPSFWEQAGHALEEAGQSLGHAAGNFLNDVASAGNAIAHHPGQAVAGAAGVALAAAGIVGEGGGTAISLTGVGAAIGVPTDVVSAGAVTAGTGMTAAAMGSLGSHASGDDQVSPVDTGDSETDTSEPPAGVKPGWESRAANNGKGTIYQRPDAPNQNADSVRIMDPGADPRYPNGYVRFYNEHGQPVGLDGKPGPNPATHIPRAEDGTYPLPEGW